MARSALGAGRAVVDMSRKVRWGKEWGWEQRYAATGLAGTEIRRASI
jgi:hypothetical protein